MCFLLNSMDNVDKFIEDFVNFIDDIECMDII